MIVTEEIREMEGQEHNSSSISDVCVGEEFPSQECIVTSMELQGVCVCVLVET